MVEPRRRDETTVVRIPRDAYEEAQKVRERYLKKPRDSSDPFTIIAAAGIGAFIGGLIGYAIANLEKNQRKKSGEERKGGE